MWASQVVVKNLPANEGDIRDMGSILDPGRFPGEEKSNPLQYSCLKNPMDRGAWQATAHGVTKSWTGLTQLSMHTHRINASSPLCLKILLWFEAEAPKLWSPDMKNQITGKYPYVGKDWRHRDGGSREHWVGDAIQPSHDGITSSMDVSLSKLRKTVKERMSGVLQSTASQTVGHSLVTEQQLS